MAFSETGTILMESRKAMRKLHNIDVTSMTDYKNMLVDDEAFGTYKKSLLESVSDSQTKQVMSHLMDKTRVKLMESVTNSYNQLSNYETLALPLLTTFYPRLIAKELVTVRPINAPDTIMPFLNYTFVKSDGTTAMAPAMNPVSFGKAVTTSDGKYVQPGTTNILTANSLTADMSSVERTMKFWKFTCTVTTGSSESPTTTNVSLEKDILPTVDGNFYEVLEDSTNHFTFFLSGKVDWLTGNVSWMLTGQDQASTPNALAISAGKLFYTCTFSLEYNTMNTKIKPTIDKVRLIIEDQQVSADWTIQLEQDANAMFDLDIQSAIIDILGQQMALDIDKAIIGDIISVASLNSSHIDSFNQNAPAGYTLGPVYWYQNILQKLMKLSAKVYADTNIGEANVIAANPVDAAIFESLNKFSFDGKGSDGGAVGYTSGNLAQRWKVFSSPVVPEGKCILMHKPTDIMRVVYVWAPYQPAVMSPYPLGNTPSLTIMSRNAKKFYRPNGCALLNITNS